MGRMNRTISEYRINKKGCECFRSRSWEATKAKLEELRAKKPSCTFTTQYRSADKDKHGLCVLDYKGRIQWSCWMDLGVRA